MSTPLQYHLKQPIVQQCHSIGLSYLHIKCNSCLMYTDAASTSHTSKMLQVTYSTNGPLGLFGSNPINASKLIINLEFRRRELFTSHVKKREQIQHRETKKYTAYLLWRFEQPVDSSNLIYQRNIFPESEERWSGGLGEIGAVKWISII